MTNILIGSQCTFYGESFKIFLAELIYESQREFVEYHSGFTKKNVNQADVIVIDLVCGEASFCIPELKWRKPGVLIGILEDKNQHSLPEALLPHCLNDVVYLYRNDSLEDLRFKILRAFDNQHNTENCQLEPDCILCNRVSLTLPQRKFASLWLQGQDTIAVAGSVNLNLKTVYSKKYALMKKYGLQTDQQLHSFINLLKTKSDR
ncbi:hypothetical protein ERD95_07850 [Enterobacteriaceae bacterium ML5]|nr:hypothetical protein ERD95_07850 [Enterobacteriaceae bacterium ML5]